LYLKSSEIEHVRYLDERYTDSFRAIRFVTKNMTSESQFHQLLEELNFKNIKDSELAKKIMDNSQVLLKKLLTNGAMTIIEHEGVNFMLFENPKGTLLFEDLERRGDFVGPPVFIFAMILIMLVILYFFTIRSIYPIKKLRKSIREFADGTLSEEKPNIKSKDEIGELAEEFYKSAKKINSLLESRQMFLRAVMHEIKTPITKARLSAEMLEQNTQKERIIKSLNAIDSIINEYASAEKLASKNYRPNLREYQTIELIEGSIDKLMGVYSTENIEIESDDEYIKADYELFTLALKNLIDNAIRYSSDKKVKISIKEGKLEVRNISKKLENIEHLFKPFTREESNTKGLGLGLYIARSAFLLCGYELKYDYIGEESIFWLDLSCNQDIDSQ